MWLRLLVLEEGRTGGGREGVKLGVTKCSLLLRHEVIDRLACLQAFLHLYKQLNSIHHHLNQLYLREAQTVSVGDVKDTTYCSCVHTTC